MNTGVDAFLNATGKIMEVAPDVYSDVVKPTAKETGQLLSKIPRLINAAFVPLDCWILTREYRIDETKKLLAKKLENIDENKIITPDPYVAVPALQAISYSMDSVELRNLYANLLAKSMNIDTKDMVHPSFVETIKQLSPNDAAYFKHICPLPIRPFVEVHACNQKNHYFILESLCNTFSDHYTNTFKLSLGSLSRLGLIDILNNIYYSDDSIYSELIRNYEEKYPLEEIIKEFPDVAKIKCEKRRIDITQYGIHFYNSCVI